MIHVEPFSSRTGPASGTLPLGELVENVHDHVAVRAQRDGSVGGGLEHQLHRRCRRSPFGKPVGRLDLELPRCGKRLERLHASQVTARKQSREVLCREELDQRLGLSSTAFRERTQLVIVGPALPVAGLRVPDEVDRAAHVAVSQCETAAFSATRARPSDRLIPTETIVPVRLSRSSRAYLMP